MSSDSSANSLFNVAIATIFAREVLEACIIIGNYRTVINKSEHMDEETKKRNLRAVTVAASWASFVAILVVLAVAIPLGILSKNLDDKPVAIIEGVSKVVASVCILQMSLKVPGWLGIYRKVSLIPCKKPKPVLTDEEKEAELGLTVQEIRFNVSWNIWREVAECGVFLIPFFLGSGTKAIPISALAGAAVALFIGIGLYIANSRMKNKTGIAVFLGGLTLFLAVGLFVGGIHEFEEYWPNGESREVYDITNPFWSTSRLPMVLLKPFGFSSSRTVMQICTFWLFLSFGCSLHYLKWRATKKLIEAEAVLASSVSKSGKTIDETDVEAQTREGASDEDRGDSNKSDDPEELEESC